MPTDTTITHYSAADPVGPLTVTISASRKISGLGNTTLWKLIADGTLQTVRVRRRRLVVYESLRRLLAPADGSTAVPQRRRPGRPRKTSGTSAVAP